MQAGAGEIWILADLSRPLKPFIFQKRRDYEFTTKEDGRTSDHVFMKDQYLYGVDARVAAGFGFWQMAFGSKADLTSANLRAAYTAMTNFTDDEGRKLNIRPTHLIVGNTNHFKARDILMSEQVGGSTNTDRNLVQLMHAPLLG
jgi:phage major head subunit gpT-like protein